MLGGGRLPPRRPSRLQWPTPVISSGASFLGSATAGPFCSAKSWGLAERGTTFSSRGPGVPLSRAAATDAPRSDRCFGSTSSARPWQRSASRRPRALAAVETGDVVMRETVLPGAILTRVASSHIRVGTFQYFAAKGDVQSLRQLASYVVARHYPDVAPRGNDAAVLLEGLACRQAGLVAQWMLVGFVHGVMNTDNCSIAGETIDYGPCAFMDAYDPSTVFSSIGRQWALCLRETSRRSPTGTCAASRRRCCRCWPTTRTKRSKRRSRPWAALSRPTMKSFCRACERSSAYRPLIPMTATLAQNLLDRMAADGRRLHVDLPRALRRRPVGRAKGISRDRTCSMHGAPLGSAGSIGEPRDAADRCASMRRFNPAFIPRNHLVEAAVEAGGGAPRLRAVRGAEPRVVGPVLMPVRPRLLQERADASDCVQKRLAALEAEACPMPTNRLIFVAHGSHQRDAAVSLRHRQRAAPSPRLLVVAGSFRGRLPAFTEALASAALPARCTAEAFGLEATPCPSPWAISDLGCWAGRTLLDVSPADIGSWLSDPDFADHGGESLTALLERMADFLASRLALRGTVIAVTHAAPMRAALVSALGAAALAFWAHRRAAARGSRVRVGR